MKKLLVGLVGLGIVGWSQPSPMILQNGWLAGSVVPSSCSSGNSPTFYSSANVLYDCLNGRYVARANGMDVTVFGADPQGIKDSTSAIKDALIAAGPAGTTFFPAGTYKTTSTIPIVGCDNGLNGGPTIIGPSAVIKATGSGYPILTLGTSTTSLCQASINFGVLYGLGNAITIDGILAQSVFQSSITFRMLSNLRYGVHVLTSATNGLAADNRFSVLSIGNTATAIYFDPASNTGNNEEGNWFDTAVFACHTGISTHAAAGSSNDDFNVFKGTYDCQGSPGYVTDVSDLAGGEMFLTDYIGTIAAIQKTSTLISANNVAVGTQLKIPLTLSDGAGNPVLKVGSSTSLEHVESGGANGDFVGAITLTSPATSGGYTFVTGWAHVPICVVSPQTYLGAVTYSSYNTVSSISILLSAPITSTFGYICVGNPN